MEAHDAWLSGKVYLDLTTYFSQLDPVVNNTESENLLLECTKGIYTLIWTDYQICV